MPHSYLLISAGALILLALTVTLTLARRRRRELPYLSDDFLFTPAQLAFKRVLDESVDASCEVYGQVRVADVIGVRAGVSRREFDRAYALVGERCFDFLVCDRRTTAILCAVNLVQPARSTGQLAPDRLDEVCTAAKLPFLRIREDDDYDRSEIEARVMAAIRPLPNRPLPSRPDRDPGRHMTENSEELDLLRELSQTIVDEGRSGDLATPQPAFEPTADSTSRPSGRPSLVKTGGKDVDSPRRPAPSIHPRDEIDEGPTFRIDGDPDDELFNRERSVRRISSAR